MSNKKFTSFELSQALNDLSAESVFDRLVKEVEAKEIPAKYIEYLTVFYKDGTSVELSGTELSNPIPVNKNASWEDMETAYNKVKTVRVFVDTKKLEIDITAQIDDLLNGKLL